MTPAAARAERGGMAAAGGAAARGARSRFLAWLDTHAAGRPDAVAVGVVGADGGVSNALSYRQLVAASCGAAERIRAAAGPGSVVMLLAPGGPEYVTWFCAALAAGVRLFPVHPQTAPAEGAELARRSGAIAVIVAPDIDVPEGLSLPRLEFDPDACLGESGVLAPGESGGVVLHSSGTTGLSKLIVRDAPSLDADGENLAGAAGLTPADAVLAAVPLCHSYGVDVLLATLRAGAALHVAPAFDAGAAAAHLETTATVFPGVPFMFEALARSAPERRPSRLRLAFSAGAPLSGAVADAFHAAWGAPAGQLYGATELGSVTLNDPASPLSAAGSVGRSFPGVSIRILDPDDLSRELPAGQAGHIAIAAPSMLTGVLDGEPPEVVDGHVLTGDLGYVDSVGRLFLTGRIKLLIDVGGFKVNPLEVEAVLASHPGVAECAVAPLPLSDTVTRLRAVFVARDPAAAPSRDELRRFLKSRLSPYKIPRVIEAAAALPKSPSGKVLRHRLGGAKPGSPCD